MANSTVVFGDEEISLEKIPDTMKDLSSSSESLARPMVGGLRINFGKMILQFQKEPIRRIHKILPVNCTYFGAKNVNSTAELIPELTVPFNFESVIKYDDTEFKRQAVLWDRIYRFECCTEMKAVEHVIEMKLLDYEISIPDKVGKAKIISNLRNIFLGLTGQAAASFIAYAHGATSQLKAIVAANGVAFCFLLLSFWFWGRKQQRPEMITGTIGIVAAVATFFLMMAMFFP